MSDAGTEKPKAEKADKKAAKKKEAPKSAGTQVAVGEAERDPNYVPRFKKRYNEVIRPELMKKFGYKNPLQVPRVTKVVLIDAAKLASLLFDYDVGVSESRSYKVKKVDSEYFDE